jgi:hypothetical protein
MAADTSKSVADNPGVIAPPPAIALATVLLGLALDWLIPGLCPDRSMLHGERGALRMAGVI